MEHIKNIAVIGCGNMATAMILPLTKKLNDKSYYFHFFSASTDSAVRLADVVKDYVSVKVEKDFVFISKMDIVFLGFKPQQLKDVSVLIKGKLKKDCILFSILAGIKIKQIILDFGVINVVRSMPNTPILVGEGLNITTLSDHFDSKKICDIKKFINLISKSMTVKEDLMDVITPVSGSGPAYLFLMGEFLSSYLQKNGFEKKMADDISLQTLYGANVLWKEKSLTSVVTPKDLRLQVTSKNGVTDKVITTLEKSNFREIFFKALEQGTQKSQSLGDP